MFKSLKTSLLCTIFLCIASIGIFFVPTNPVGATDIFTEATVSDAFFNMKISADSRRNNTLPLNIKKADSETESKTFYCFNWRDLESLEFRFSSNIRDSSYQFTSYQFLMTYIKTEDLNTSMGLENPKILNQGNISANNFSQFTFHYYVDSEIDISETSLRSKGNDFGLYKFDFNYTYIDDGTERTLSIGEFYVAVVPDKVEEIDYSGIKILYTVTSSNKLMNIFNLYLSTDAYKYVDPEQIQWNVIGQDKTNIDYVLSQKIKDENPEFANYRVIWQSQNPIEPTGTAFLFDSNDIEGTWSVYCTIKTKSGEDKVTLIQENLSTIKQETKSYVWLILLIIAIVLVIAVAVTLIVLKTKHDKVW